MNTNKKNTVSVGIYTRYGGPSLVSSVSSIRQARNGGELEIIIIADGKPITSEVKTELAKLNVKVIERKGLSGVISKIKDLVCLASGEIIILTQDDVCFADGAILEIEKVFQKNINVTMVASKITPAQPEKFFESILEIGSQLVQKIGQRWKSGDNYLLSNGRCSSFRTAAIRRFSFPEKIMNSDAYLYFINKKLGGGFVFAEKSIVFYRSPQTLKEHFNQSTRFQTSKIELSEYFGSRMLKNEYRIPSGIFVEETLKEFFRYPIRSAAYFAVSLYTRFKPRKAANVINPHWKVDESTKRYENYFQI